MKFFVRNIHIFEATFNITCDRILHMAVLEKTPFTSSTKEKQDPVGDSVYIVSCFLSCGCYNEKSNGLFCRKEKNL